MKNAKVLSALGLMSLASTAALAAGGPTLGSVLDASGVSVSGNVAASFRQNANKAENNFQVDQALLSIAYQPKEGYGAVVDVASGDTNLQCGRFSNLDCDTATNPNGTALTQAYLQYKSGALTVQGGRFYTAAGYEVFPVTGNLFVSRSLTFGQESTYHTGLRGSYAATDALTVNFGVNDGIYNNLDNEPSVTKNKAFELGASLAVTSDLSLALTTYTGKDGTTAANKQSLYSLVASYNLSKDLSFAANVDMVNKDGTDAGKATNIALYATYAVSDKVKAGLRLEELNPKGSAKNNTGSVTAVVSYAAAKNFDIRTELSDVDPQAAAPQVLAATDPVAAKKRTISAAVQGVLKF